MEALVDAVDVKDKALLWRLVSAGFAQRRKTIYNNLRNAGNLFANRNAEDEFDLLVLKALDQELRCFHVCLQ